MNPKRDIVDKLEGRFAVFDEAGNVVGWHQFKTTAMEREAAREIRALRIALKSKLHDLIARKSDESVEGGSHI